MSRRHCPLLWPCADGEDEPTIGVGSSMTADGA